MTTREISNGWRSAEYISLAQLARKAQIYERMPVMMQDALRLSVWLTLGAEIAAILLVLLIPDDLLIFGVSGGFFYFTADWINSLLRVCHDIFPAILMVNSINLVVTLIILAISQIMTRRVKEPVHWLAAIQAVPTGLSAVAFVIIGALLVSIAIVSLLLWIIVIIIFLIALAMFLS